MARRLAKTRPETSRQPELTHVASRCTAPPRNGRQDRHRYAGCAKRNRQMVLQRARSRHAFGAPRRRPRTVYGSLEPLLRPARRETAPRRRTPAISSEEEPTKTTRNTTEPSRMIGSHRELLPEDLGPSSPELHAWRPTGDRQSARSCALPVPYLSGTGGHGRYWAVNRHAR